ncbi:MAG: hypothetical protein U1B30_00155 [Pseudomonadota bacterium]|nr:hypothetical protein [Pseudomonadota bacterium]
MDPINVNHAQVLYSTAGIKAISDSSSSSSSPEVVLTEIKLSANETKVTLESAAEADSKPRFASMEEYNQHKATVYAQWVTLEELETGTRRPYATEEDARLATLTMKELMEESTKLPRIDSNGHLQSSIFGTEQSDRIRVATANKIFEGRHEYNKAAESVESSVKNFKLNIEKKLNIAADSYDIVFSNGKITAVGKGTAAADENSLKKIQDVLDNPTEMKVAMVLSADIEKFNKAAVVLVENNLTQYIYGASKDPYLEKNLSKDWLMEGMNYANATKSSHLNNQYTALFAEAHEKYDSSLKNGTHFENFDTDPGILELTNLRKGIDTNA